MGCGCWLLASVAECPEGITPRLLFGRTDTCMVALALQVILMSATINCEEFADYFAVPVQNKMSPAYIFEVEGKPYSIEEYYLDDLEHIHHNRLSPHRLEEPSITKDVYEVTVSLIQMFDDLDLKESGRSRTWSGAPSAPVRSSVLVFLPAGLAERRLLVLPESRRPRASGRALHLQGSPSCECWAVRPAPASPCGALSELRKGCLRPGSRQLLLGARCAAGAWFLCAGGHLLGPCEGVRREEAVTDEV
ncbi:hypothetical protein CB1_001049005 [Camelus ferus]|nr:hypothetical protein CB1_001049005 [Camelus ferus]